MVFEAAVAIVATQDYGLQGRSPCRRASICVPLWHC